MRQLAPPVLRWARPVALFVVCFLTLGYAAVALADCAGGGGMSRSLDVIARELAERLTAAHAKQTELLEAMERATSLPTLETVEALGGAAITASTLRRATAGTLVAVVATLRLSGISVARIKEAAEHGAAESSADCPCPTCKGQRAQASAEIARAMGRPA